MDPIRETDDSHDSLYGLKSLGVAFRKCFSGVLHKLNYRPTNVDPGVWLLASTKPDVTKWGFS